MGLLSPIFKECSKKAFTIGNFFGTHPFAWDKRTNSPRLATSWKKLALWRLNVLITILYVSFLAVRCLQVNLSDESEFSTTVKIYMIYISLLYSFPVVHQCVFIKKKGQILLFYKQTFSLFDQLSKLLNEVREFGNSGNSGQNGTECHMPKILDLCLPFLWNLCLTFSGFVGVFALVLPNSPELISSVILPESGNGSIGSGVYRWILRMLCALFQYNFMLLYSINGILYLALFFGFVFPEFVVLRQIKRWLIAGHTRNIPRERIQKILKIYRQLKILQEFFHDQFCDMIFPFFKTLMMIWIVLGIFGLVRINGILSGLLGLFSFAIIFLMIAMIASCAELHDKSKAILYLMKSYDIQKCLRPSEKKTVKSFRLIQIQMRSSYVIDKLNVLTVLKVVSDSTVSFLVAHV